MPFTPPPKVPNYNPGNGSRLVTDRYDFEAHLEGTNPPVANAPLQNFRHTAPQIDLMPDLTVFNGTQNVTVTNVQDALALLASIVSPPDIHPATTASLGIVQLAGDIAGTATSVLVKGLQGRPINPSVPTPGQVLTFASGSWGPANAPNAVVFSGDLSGFFAGPQTVIGIRGVVVSSATPVTNQILQYNGTQWAPTTISGTFSAGGDLSGSSSSQTVTGLQTRPVSTSAPSTGQVLGWSGAVWAPTNAISSLNGDVVGPASTNVVETITGVSSEVGNVVSVVADQFVWTVDSGGPNLSQAPNTTNSATASDFSIQAQAGIASGSNGGNLNLIAGFGTVNNGNVNIGTGNQAIAQFAQQLGDGYTQLQTVVKHQIGCLTVVQNATTTTHTQLIIVNAPPATNHAFDVKVECIGRGLTTGSDGYGNDGYVCRGRNAIGYKNSTNNGVGITGGDGTGGFGANFAIVGDSPVTPLTVSFALNGSYQLVIDIQTSASNIATDWTFDVEIIGN